MKNVRSSIVRAAERGVSLVEVLIVVAIMSLVAGMAVMVAYPEMKKARVRVASIGASSVREAAKSYREIDLGGDAAVCPTVSDLVAARKMDPKKRLDPWGMDYVIACVDDDIDAFSTGVDKRAGTQDDVHSDLRPVEIERISKL